MNRFKHLDMRKELIDPIHSLPLCEGYRELRVKGIKGTSTSKEKDWNGKRRSTQVKWINVKRNENELEWKCWTKILSFHSLKIMIPGNGWMGKWMDRWMNWVRKEQEWKKHPHHVCGFRYQTSLIIDLIDLKLKKLMLKVTNQVFSYRSHSKN